MSSGRLGGAHVSDPSGIRALNPNLPPGLRIAITDLLVEEYRSLILVMIFLVTESFFFYLICQSIIANSPVPGTFEAPGNPAAFFGDEILLLGAS